jgi:lambda repressor-like predicted transcriptional regulator
MAGATRRSDLSNWAARIDDRAVDDDALRTFAHLLRTYLDRGAEDREGIASMAAIVADPESDADDVRAALDTLRESLHSTAEALDLEAEGGLSEGEREAARRMDSEEATFAERLRALLAASGMSQVRLARASGVGQPAISMMLARDCRPQRRTVERLSRALGVPPEELWPGFGAAADREVEVGSAPEAAG